MGLVGGLAWSVVATVSMPNGLVPGESCARKVGLGDAYARTSYFPPSAQCVGADEVREYMSPPLSAILSVVGVILLLVIAVGLILTAQRLTGDPGPVRAGEGIDLKRRRRSHLLFGALDLAAVFAIVMILSVMMVVLGGAPGGLLFVLTSLVGLSALGTVLDRHTGPLPSSARESLRRGTIAGVTTYGVVFAATAVTGQLPFFRFWSIPLAAITYVVIAARQWSKVSRVSTASRAQYSG
ncbi:hypothetical protein [Kribbella sp. NPDC048915]|uniref:hypothetical protein n=1 Tax=Kribbella sp. NPDC048915 TaxID=3155148 RepID=UPI0033D21DAC